MTTYKVIDLDILQTCEEGEIFWDINGCYEIGTITVEHEKDIIEALIEADHLTEFAREDAICCYNGEGSFQIVDTTNFNIPIFNLVECEE